MSVVLSRILLATLPFQFVLPLLGDWDIPLARLLSAAIIVAFCIEQLIKRAFPAVSMAQTAILFSFLFWIVSSLLWTAHITTALPKMFFLLNILPLFFVWQEALRRPYQADAYIQSTLVGAAAAAFVAMGIFLAQFIFGVSETFHFLLERILPFFLGKELAFMVAQYPSLLVNIGGETWLRATAFFPDPHVAAFFFGLTGFLALGYARQSSDRRYFFLAITLFLADILSFSRGGYIGLLVGLASYLFFSRGLAWPQISRSVHRAVWIGAAILIVFGPAIGSRFLSSFTLGDASSVARISLWSDAFETLKQYPFFGTGLGNYLSVARPLAASDTPFYAHNLYLDVAIETGLVGITFFGALLVTTLCRLLSLRGRNALAAGIFGALFLYLSHSIFETALFSTHVSIMLTFLLALSTSMGRPNLLQSRHAPPR